MTPDPTNQPLYIPPEERVSLDEIKQRVGTIQDLAVVQAKDVANEIYDQHITRAAMVAVGVVVVAASIAYFVGSRVARRVVEVGVDLGPRGSRRVVDVDIDVGPRVARRVVEVEID